MDLQNLQQQLKVAIQSHQILVSKMKADPQNTTLQRQLHELQAEIMNLSEKQKQVVQQLRKEIETKQQAVTSTCILSTQLGPVISQDTSSPVQTLALPLTRKSDSSQIKLITPISSPITVMPTNLSIKTNSDQNQSSFISNTTKSNDNTIGLLNLAPPIRVPQYPPPLNRPSVLQSHNRPLSTSPPCTHQTVPAEKHTLSPKLKTDPADLLKVDFMAALGLITHDTLSEAKFSKVKSEDEELQNRRSERKRRTTANPQFSYGNWEHSDFLFSNSQKKRKTNNYLSSPVPPNFKRPRAAQNLSTPGRPRLGSTPNNSRPNTPEFGPESRSLNGFTTSVLRNGSTVKEHDDTCALCQNPDNLLNCDTCTLSYHRTCLEPPIIEMNLGPWICPKCQLAKKNPLQWPGSLAMVHSYIAHKAAKEEEKRKLIKRSLELKSERSQLEQKAKQLSETISLQMQRRSELVHYSKEAQESIEKLKTFIKYFQVS